MFFSYLINSCICSVKSPETDESDAGNRDPLLLTSYKRLSNLRYASYLPCILSALMIIITDRRK
jgi:hypothetical protein